MSVALEENAEQANMGPLERIKHWWAFPLLRGRLLVLLPFTFSFLTLATGLLVLHSFRSRLRVGDAVDPLVWNQIIGVAGITILVCGAVTFASGMFLATAIRQGLRCLGEAADQVGRGNLGFASEEIYGSEIQQLHDHFRRMAQAVNNLVQETGMGATVSVDMAGNVAMLNSLAQLMLGVEPTDAVGKPFQNLLGAAAGGGANAELVRAVEGSLRSQEPLAERETELRLADGRFSRVKVRTSFYNDEGSPHMAIVLLDRKMAETGDVRRQIERAARFLTLGAFATTLAHEIRNPLGSLAGLAELLREEEPDAALRDEFIHHIQEGTDRLNRLIEGLMDIASLENCVLSPESPKDIAQEAVGERLRIARSRGVELDVRFDENLPLVNGNREWLSRALRNLVDNALDETPQGGQVLVRVRSAQAAEDVAGEASPRPCVEFSVHNTGSFIPEERRKKVFEPFETGKQTGMGLGLSIVQEIVQSHGGTVWLESNPKKGTRFAFRVSAAD